MFAGSKNIADCLIRDRIVRHPIHNILWVSFKYDFLQPHVVYQLNTSQQPPRFCLCRVHIPILLTNPLIHLPVSSRSTPPQPALFTWWSTEPFVLYFHYSFFWSFPTSTFPDVVWLVVISVLRKCCLNLLHLNLDPLDFGGVIGHWR